MFSAVFLARPRAHSNIVFLLPVVAFIPIFIFSSNFSNTRGTPKNIVGETSFNVGLSEPYKHGSRSQSDRDYCQVSHTISYLHTLYTALSEQEHVFLLQKDIS